MKFPVPARFQSIDVILRPPRFRNCSSSWSNVQRFLSAKSDKSSRQRKPKHTNSFGFNIFLGKLVPDQFFPYPDVLEPERKDIMRLMLPPVERFLQGIDYRKLDETCKIPPEVMDGLKAMGAFGILVPEEYGGLGCVNTQYARLSEVIAKYDLGLSIMLGAHQSIGYKGILLEGTPEQKEKYLPSLATGQVLAAFALTEPSSGSDAGSIRSRAIPSHDGQTYHLTGNKLWISNGGIADVFTVFAQTPIENEEGEIVDKVTAFIVERSFGGVTSGPPEDKMGIRCSNTTTVHFDNTPVPVENVLGQIGGGFKVAVNILNNGRFGMGAALSGTMRMAIHEAVSFATERVQFGRTIDKFGAIQEKITRMCMMHYATESLAYIVSSNMDLGVEDFQIEAAVSKVFASEAAWFTVDEAIQILGGMGFMKDCPLERLLRDLRIFRIFEGTNDILRLFIALTGIQHAGLHLRELQAALKNPMGNLGVLLNVVSKRTKDSLGVTSERESAVIENVHPNLHYSALLLAKSVGLFGRAIEGLLRKYGKDIVEKQMHLWRVSNAAIDIVTMAAVLSRSSASLQNRMPSAAIEEAMAIVWCSEAADRIQHNLAASSAKEDAMHFSLMTQISQEVCANGGVVQTNPIGF